MLSAALVLGSAIRLRQATTGRSLWLNEALIALNVLNRDIAQLFEPLDYNQVAPAGYLILTKAATVMFGPSEYALRLVPFISSIAGLLLLWIVARRTLIPSAAITAVALFAFMGPPIYFAGEVKPYSTDAAVTLALVAIALSTERAHLAWRWTIGLTVAGALAFWFSLPAVFVLAAIIFAQLCWIVGERAWRLVPRLALPCVVWGANLGFGYYFMLASVQNNAFLRAYWSDRRAFMPLPPRTLGDLKWFFDRLPGIVNDAGLTPGALAAVFFVLGCLVLAQRQRTFLVLCVGSIGAAMIASGLRLYPFEGRFLLFVVPLVLLCTAAGIVDVVLRTWTVYPALSVVALSILLLLPAISGFQALIHPRRPEEVKTVLQYVQARRRPDDLLYVYYGAQYQYKYYARRYGLPDDFAVDPFLTSPRDPSTRREWEARTGVVIGLSSRQDYRGYMTDLDRVTRLQYVDRMRRVWLLFSHQVRGSDDTSEQAVILSRMEHLGQRVDGYTDPAGTAVFCFELPPRSGAVAVRR